MVCRQKKPRRYFAGLLFYSVIKPYLTSLAGTTQTPMLASVIAVMITLTPSFGAWIERDIASVISLNCGENE
tara:strand:- start:412 stop:627 length:216 start_codon:yes stop_codon:yes gene_type:complete